MFPRRSAKMWRRESADSSEFDWRRRKTPNPKTFLASRVAPITGALWPTRGERGIFYSPRLALRTRFTLRNRFALRAKCRHRLAWLIKHLLCRLHCRSRVMRNSYNSGRFIYENTKWHSTQSMGRKIRSRAKILYSWINVKRPFTNRSLLMQSWIPIDINIHSDWGKRLTAGAYIFACVFNGIQGHCQAKIWDNACSVSSH